MAVCAKPPRRAPQPTPWCNLLAVAPTHQVRLLSKKRTRKSFSPASACFCSPSFSTSSGGTGMGTPLCRRPSRGILGSMIWRQERRRHSAAGGGGEQSTLHQTPCRTAPHQAMQGLSQAHNQVMKGADLFYDPTGPQNGSLGSPFPVCWPNPPSPAQSVLPMRELAP